MKATIDTVNKTLTILDQNFKFKELVNFITNFNLQDYTIDNTATPYWTVTSTPSTFNDLTIRSGYLSTAASTNPNK